MSIMVSTGDEVSTAAQWLKTTLKGDTSPGGLFFPAAPLVTDAFESIATEEQPFPYIIYHYQGGDDVDGNDSQIIWVSMLYVVKVLGLGPGTADLSPIYERIHSRIHHQSGTVSHGVVNACVRIGTISYPEKDDGGEWVRHHGGMYRLYVQSS